MALVFLSCTKKDDNLSSSDMDIGKDMVFDSVLNCFMPKNFYDYEHIIVDKLPDSKTMESMKNKLKSGPLSIPVPGGAISDSYIKIVGDAGGYEEVSLTLRSGWIVTGVGVLIASSSNNYVVLLLEKRYVYSDGSMSSRYIDWDRTRTYVAPSQCEAWCSVPPNSLAIGVGIKGKYDVSCLDLYYKYFNGSTNRLYGPNYYVHSGSLNVYDNYWIPQLDNLDEYRVALLGLGFVANTSGTAKLSLAYGYLR
jgi:hypothetical protein